MQELRCFQKIHAPSMTSELKPSLACFCTFFKDFLHQAAKEIVPRVGYQTREVQRLHDVEPELPGEDTRSENMLNVFVFLVAEGAMSRMWQASFFRRSAVQQRFRIASQIKILHLLGAHDFH